MIEEIREGIKSILFDDLVLWGITHENAPPHKDCLEACDVLTGNTGEYLGEHGKTKHRRCMDCWNEYIDDLVNRIEKIKKLDGNSD